MYCNNCANPPLSKNILLKVADLNRDILSQTHDSEMPLKFFFSSWRFAIT
jgi:hypothetical protein